MPVPFAVFVSSAQHIITGYVYVLVTHEYTCKRPCVSQAMPDMNHSQLVLLTFCGTEIKRFNLQSLSFVELFGEARRWLESSAQHHGQTPLLCFHLILALTVVLPQNGLVRDFLSRYNPPYTMNVVKFTLDYEIQNWSPTDWAKRRRLHQKQNEISLHLPLWIQEDCFQPQTKKEVAQESYFGHSVTLVALESLKNRICYCSLCGKIANLFTAMLFEWRTRHETIYSEDEEELKKDIMEPNAVECDAFYCHDCAHRFIDETCPRCQRRFRDKDPELEDINFREQEGFPDACCPSCSMKLGNFSWA